jgi:hypothetical protein
MLSPLGHLNIILIIILVSYYIGYYGNDSLRHLRYYK